MKVLSTNQAASSSVPDLRDIKPPVAISSGWEWLWWALAGVTLIVVALVLWKMWRKKQAAAPAGLPIPAHVRAKKRLEEALGLIAQPKPFVTEVSDVARRYLEERFEFHAPERTTEEFLHELKRTDLLTRDQKDSLGAFLLQCDLVKFAKFEPHQEKLRELHGAALRLVEETEPFEAQQPEVQAEAPQAA
jgi:hypothetical protein